MATLQNTLEKLSADLAKTAERRLKKLGVPASLTAMSFVASHTLTDELPVEAPIDTEREALFAAHNHHCHKNQNGQWVCPVG